MAYNKRKPPIMVELTIDSFNLLIGYLSNIMEENKKDIAIKLKEKLLQYSIPNLTESDTFIVVRFFNQEASQLINLLIGYYNNKNDEINYYEMLLENRRKRKEGV